MNRNKIWQLVFGAGILIWSAFFIGVNKVRAVASLDLDKTCREIKIPFGSSWNDAAGITYFSLDNCKAASQAISQRGGVRGLINSVVERIASINFPWFNQSINEQGHIAQETASLEDGNAVLEFDDNLYQELSNQRASSFQINYEVPAVSCYSFDGSWSSGENGWEMARQISDQMALLMSIQGMQDVICGQDQSLSYGVSLNTKAPEYSAESSEVNGGISFGRVGNVNNSRNNNWQLTRMLTTHEMMHFLEFAYNNSIENGQPGSNGNLDGAFVQAYNEIVTSEDFLPSSGAEYIEVEDGVDTLAAYVWFSLHEQGAIDSLPERIVERYTDFATFKETYPEHTEFAEHVFAHLHLLPETTSTSTSTEVGSAITTPTPTPISTITPVSGSAEVEDINFVEGVAIVPNSYFLNFPNSEINVGGANFTIGRNRLDFSFNALGFSYCYLGDADDEDGGLRICLDSQSQSGACLHVIENGQDTYRCANP